MKNIALKLLLIIAIAVFVISGVRLFLIYNEYNAGSEEYQKVAKYVTVPAEEAATTATSTELDYRQKLIKNGIPVLDIDYESLKETNPDFLGWLYLPGLGISYPVVQGEDDDYYLHHTFEKAANSSGCVFAAARAAKSMTDYNTLFYGHNMKNGTMFGSLKKYMREEGTYKNNSCFYFYTEDYSYKYKIYAYYITPPTSTTYAVLENREQYKVYIDDALSKSLIDCGVEVSEERPTVTLSTCTGSGANKQRFVVHGIQEAAVPTKE